MGPRLYYARFLSGYEYSSLTDVGSDQTTRLLCFEWDYTASLRTVKQLGTHGQPVGRFETLPILLIPLTIASAFILVCEHVVSVYRNILTGTATRRVIEHYEDPANYQGGSSRKPPLWTYWARPVRTADYSSGHDDLFLCREDGIVKALDIAEETEVMLNAQVNAGALGCNIDTAFSSLDLGLNHPDLLIAGGDMSVGGIFEVSLLHISYLHIVYGNALCFVEVSLCISCVW